LRQVCPFRFRHFAVFAFGCRCLGCVASARSICRCFSRPRSQSICALPCFVLVWACLSAVRRIARSMWCVAALAAHVALSCSLSRHAMRGVGLAALERGVCWYSLVVRGQTKGRGLKAGLDNLANRFSSRPPRCDRSLPDSSKSSGNRQPKIRVLVAVSCTLWPRCFRPLWHAICVAALHSHTPTRVCSLSSVAPRFLSFVTVDCRKNRVCLLSDRAF
jgi:hypothetical protein